MYRLFVRYPAGYNFDVVEVLSDVMDTQMSIPMVDSTTPADEPIEVGVKADSLALVDALKGWLDRVPDAGLDVHLMVGKEAISLRNNSLASAKAAVQKASGPA